MIKRLVLWVIVLAAGFASLAEALPCITQMAPVASTKVDCMAGMAAGMSMTKQAAPSVTPGCMTVSECFKAPALPADTVAVNVQTSADHSSVAILPEHAQPVSLLGQHTVRPPPLPDIARYTPTHQFLASLSRWLI